VLSEACDTINKFRRKSGIAENLGRMVRRPDYNSFSDLELHAELCHAECLLLRAGLTLCEDETLVSFVKAGLKVRTCYQSFRCVKSRAMVLINRMLFAENAGAPFSTEIGASKSIAGTSNPASEWAWEPST